MANIRQSDTRYSDILELRNFFSERSLMLYRKLFSIIRQFFLVEIPLSDCRIFTVFKFY